MKRRATGPPVHLDRYQRPTVSGLRLLALTVFLSHLAVPVMPQDWPEWRGPGRNGIATDFEPPREWPQQLRREWSQQVGPGVSSPVVADGRVFAFVRDGRSESLVALRLTDGKLLWRQSYEAGLSTRVKRARSSYYQAPFSTPVVRAGRVFTFGMREVVTGWDAESGERLWQRNYGKELGSPRYGFSQSPLALADRVIAHVGGEGRGALVALAFDDGRELWRTATRDGPSYGSPILAELDGVAQIATLTKRRFAGFDLESGEELWETPFRTIENTAAATPVLYRGLLILSADHRPSRAFRPQRSDTGWTVSQEWETREFVMHLSSPVVVGERLFGFSLRNGGQLVCADPATGAVLWAGPPRQGENASLVSAGNVLLVFREDAVLFVVDASADEFHILASFQVGNSGPMWSHPAVFGRSILVKDFDQLHLWSVREALLDRRTSPH